MKSSMEKGHICGVVFLDLTKAFDTVDHGIQVIISWSLSQYFGVVYIVFEKSEKANFL